MNTLLLIIVLIVVALASYYAGSHGYLDQYLNQIELWRNLND